MHRLFSSTTVFLSKEIHSERADWDKLVDCACCGQRRLAGNAGELKWHHKTQEGSLDIKNVMRWQGGKETRKRDRERERESSKERVGVGGGSKSMGGRLLAPTEARSRIQSGVPSQMRRDHAC